MKTILEGAKRRLSVPIKKKDPITPDLLSLVENIYLIDGLLMECKSSNTVQNYYYVFLRWQTLGFIQWNT